MNKQSDGDLLNHLQQDIFKETEDEFKLPPINIQKNTAFKFDEEDPGDPHLPEAHDAEVTQRLELPKDISMDSAPLMPIKEVEQKTPQGLQQSEDKSPKVEEKDDKLLMKNLTQKQLTSLAVFNNLYSGAQDNTMRSLIRNH